MRTKSMASLIVMLGVIVGLAATGCQQQRKPRSASTSKVKGLNRIYFDFDRSEIKPEYRQTMDDNASWLKANRDVDITIEGHCDERGTEEYNMALGHRRANSAKSYLVSMGVSSNRMRTVSYGEERPLETCHNESCWWKNRRAEFVH